MVMAGTQSAGRDGIASPRLVGPIGDRIRRYCVPDRAGDGGRCLISSLYVDNPRRRLYRDTMDRCPSASSCGFAAMWAVRHSSRSTSIKTSSKRVARQLLPICGQPSSTTRADSRGPAQRKAPEYAGQFTNKCLALGAEPSALVRYEREAWFSTTDDCAGHLRSPFDDGAPHGLVGAVDEPIG